MHCGEPWAPREEVSSADVDPRGDAESAGLVDQEADARPGAAFLVESETGLLVEQVVNERRELPSTAQESEAQVGDVVGRQLRVEPEGALGQRTADRVRAERIEVHEAEP